MLKYLFCALRNLSRKKFRSAITIGGIVIGVASVIVIGTIGSGATLAVNNELDCFGINGINISQLRANVFDKTALMTNDDLKLCMNVKGVEDTMPLVMQTGNIVLRNVQKDALIWGVDNNAKNMVSFKVLHGKMFTKSQINSHDKVCLIDDTIAKNIYKRSNVTGKTISLFMGKSYEDFKIIGVVESGSSLLYNLVGEYMPSFIYLPYTTAQDLRGTDGFDQIMVRGKENVNLDTLGNNICHLLSNSNPDQKYCASNMLNQKERFSGLLGIVTLAISAVGAISLVVAGLGIMTVMLVSVNERTKEIGIKKAIGAKKSIIMLEFLFEALSISIIGGALGVGIGFAVAFIVSNVLKMAFIINSASVMLATAFALGTGILFGVYPAYKAANLRPVEALRQE